ncbi:hypothetical protein IQ254_18570 [Nodosilinea sp. LEGE 07088]|uniref:hypothetical protein n=1 Tax=Nodosilinea sp. LEGE 07088 TaxID=2777968 RepID=UPI001881260B|nr:hypothetical protein [Nodosilinea sp. LEGE 07088]MBE9139175.1 hypothetical protein [Nodosilinea sp. LEGE 07088]
MKIHVFLNDGGQVVAISPAPTSPTISKLPAGEAEITFDRSEPAQTMSRLRRYELDSDADLSIDLNQFEAAQIQQQAADVIKSRPNLRPVEF